MSDFWSQTDRRKVGRLVKALGSLREAGLRLGINQFTLWRWSQIKTEQQRNPSSKVLADEIRRRLDAELSRSKGIDSASAAKKSRNQNNRH
jgi:hypothetical protein